MEHLLQPSYQNHYGVDLRSSDLNRPMRFASGMRNAQYTPAGSIEKRKGFMAHAASQAGFGQFAYKRRNPETGVDESEIVGVSGTLYRQLETTLTVVYSGANPTAIISLFFDPGTDQYRCLLQEGTSDALDVALGLGFDEAVPVTVGDLQAAINAVPGFAAVVKGSSSTPAAFLKIVRAWDLSATGSSFSTVARYWEAVNTTVPTPLANFYSRRNERDFENASAVNLSNCIYIATGYDETMKYDGQTFYRAGLPVPATLATADSGAGNISGSNYVHRARYSQWDAAGNLVEGSIKNSTVIPGPLAGRKISVTVANIQAGSGFNTNCAIVAGAQAGVTTITVDDGAGGSHTMKVGDTAYFKDGLSGEYVERAVTGVTPTSITIAGAAVNVADNAVISNNLRIAIYRGKTSGVSIGGSLQYMVEEVPNNSFAATQTITDNLADADLGELLIEPLADRSPPPKGKYISAWDGEMAIAGHPTSRNTLYLSQDGPEYFPAGARQYEMETAIGDSISGIAQNNEVFIVMKDQAFIVGSGDVAADQIRFETKAQDVGCVAHATIQEINGVLYWLSDQGPRWSTGGQLPSPVGVAYDPDGKESEASRIDPVFDNDGVAEDLQLRLKRAVAVNDRKGKKYILFVPAESQLAGESYANSNSKVFAYEYNRDAWLLWDNLNMAGGVCLFGDELLWQERRYSISESAVQALVYRRHNLEDAWDYADNDAPVGGVGEDLSWSYDSAWEACDDPAVLKRPLKLRIYSLEQLPNNDFTVNVHHEVNYQVGFAKAVFPISLAGSGYGVGAYGTGVYGDPAEPKVDHTVHRERQRSWRFRFANNKIHENVLISGWVTEIAAPFRRELKR